MITVRENDEKNFCIRIYFEELCNNVMAIDEAPVNDAEALHGVFTTEYI